MANSKQPPNPAPVIRQFLADCPEYIPEVRTTIIDGREEVVLTSDGVAALAEWGIRTGRIPPSRHERARAAAAKMKQAAAEYAASQRSETDPPETTR